MKETDTDHVKKLDKALDVLLERIIETRATADSMSHLASAYSMLTAERRERLGINRSFGLDSARALKED
jgi:hypothetical protein